MLFGLRVRDVDCDFRLMRREHLRSRSSSNKNSGVICLEMMKKIHDAGFRIVGSAGASLSPRVRPLAVLQLPPRLQDRRRRAEAVDARWSSARAPPPEAAGARTPTRPASRSNRTGVRRSRERGLSVVLSRPPRDDHRRPRLHRQQPRAPAGRRSGADVLLVDSLIPDYGGNLFNIDGHRAIACCA